MTDFILPELGENVTAGDVLRVLVKPGEAIGNDQPVIELETDKATIEVPSTVAGTIREVKVKAGDKVKVGQPIFSFDGPKDTKEAKPDTKEATPVAKAEAKDASAESAGPKPQPEGATTESKPEHPAPPPRLPEDEVEQEAPAPRQRRGEVVDISRAPRTAAPAAPAEQGPMAPAAPSVRRIARELGVDIREVTGTGPGNRVTVDDVQGFVREALASGAPTPASGAPAGQALPDFSKWGEVERKPISNVRRKTAEHLGHAWSVIPAVTQHDRADITALEALRKQYGPQVERTGGKLTVTAIALKILAGALKKFPQFASSIDPGRGQIVYKKYVNIGVAVDTERGLLVPVIRDVDAKGMTELSAELSKASEKARAGKLSLEEMSGGVITITNLGGIGGVGFTPIVNWPEVAILGISRGSYQPVWNGSAFEPRLMLPLSLSYDHRMIDGADAARFLRWIAEALEQPFMLAL
ncbi:MAG: 2-oxo acid dehydrogenase subunit E2 [Vicinamibacterales bacterium]